MAQKSVVERMARRRAKVLAVMTDPAFDGATQQAIADAVGISRRTLREYLTQELWREIKSKRLEVVTRTLEEHLEDVDKAVLEKAKQGDLTAARLVYARWDKLRAADVKLVRQDIPASLEEINAELRQLKQDIEQLDDE